VIAQAADQSQARYKTLVPQLRTQSDLEMGSDGFRARGEILVPAKRSGISELRKSGRKQVSRESKTQRGKNEKESLRAPSTPKSLNENLL